MSARAHVTLSGEQPADHSVLTACRAEGLKTVSAELVARVHRSVLDGGAGLLLQLLVCPQLDHVAAVYDDLPVRTGIQRDAEVSIAACTRPASGLGRVRTAAAALSRRTPCSWRDRYSAINRIQTPS